MRWIAWGDGAPLRATKAFLSKGNTSTQSKTIEAISTSEIVILLKEDKNMLALDKIDNKLKKNYQVWLVASSEASNTAKVAHTNNHSLLTTALPASVND